MSSCITLILTCLLLAVAAWQDILYRKIPNSITFPMILCGIVLSVFFTPKETLWRLFFLVLLFFFGMFRIMGMGDLKLLMAVCALRGPMEASATLFIGSILLIFYSFMTEPAATKQTMKDTVRFLAFGLNIPKWSDTMFPLGLFMAAAYPAAVIATGGLPYV